MSSDIVTNRKALRDFEILDRMEAGVCLVGTEVKSIRLGRVDLLGAFARVEKKGVYLYEATIQAYEQASHETHDPKRPRKLLLHKLEIKRLAEQTLKQGRALPVLRLYWKKGHVKVELGIGRGKHTIDKRQDIKKREVQREMQREAAQFRSGKR
ncbi:MAG: SsrA-binding protein SmpB [Chthoniobacterales bacterium]|nr:SsrA-binding protein SmpB [Chthoniobacterales bacterium]